MHSTRCWPWATARRKLLRRWPGCPPISPRPKRSARRCERCPRCYDPTRFGHAAPARAVFANAPWRAQAQVSGPAEPELADALESEVIKRQVARDCTAILAGDRG